MNSVLKDATKDVLFHVKKDIQKDVLYDANFGHPFQREKVQPARKKIISCIS